MALGDAIVTNLPDRPGGKFEKQEILEAIKTALSKSNFIATMNPKVLEAITHLTFGVGRVSLLPSNVKVAEDGTTTGVAIKREEGLYSVGYYSFNTY